MNYVYMKYLADIRFVSSVNTSQEKDIIQRTSENIRVK